MNVQQHAIIAAYIILRDMFEREEVETTNIIPSGDVNQQEGKKWGSG